jgi:iron complex outermembrane receptor protein
MKKATTRLLLVLLLGMWSMAGIAQQQRSVSGTVTDSVGNPIAGASISIKNGRSVAVTDAKGNFQVSLTPAQKTLVISYVGYESTEVDVSNQTSVSVTLKSASAMAGNEVVVTALGIRRSQRSLGYATSVVKGEDIVKTAPTNFASALYGKAPGVSVTSNPGGATSAVSIQIRGINSIGYQRQPLLVVDGVIVRNGDANQDGYWGGNQRINGNGLLDINPENIESINILKGAAASALYGSDANFGVIVITTKSGKGLHRGIGVDASYSFNTEKAATTPDVQTEYGPGYDWQTNLSLTGNDTGWIHEIIDGQQVTHPRFADYGQFGPKTDGRPIYYWDGTTRPYVGHNNWNAFYRTGYNSIANVALNSNSDKLNYRLSYTRNDYEGIQIGGKDEKNTFNLNSTVKITSKISADVIVSYINDNVHNRPRQVYYLTNNYGGFFSSADYMDMYFDKYQTSRGYKYTAYNNTTIENPEKLKYAIRGYDFLDFLWNQLANSYDETTNRFIASGTINYNILPGLNLRGRIGTDFTGYHLEDQQRSTQPIAYGASGVYGVQNNQYVFTSGDLLLSYNHKIVKDFSFTASAGYQARKEFYSYSSAYTQGGLTVENWFSLNASKSTDRTGATSRSYLVKDGLFGILDLNYHDYLYASATIRRERSSTLYPGNNTFYYPGVSGAFELSNAFHLPAVISYSKIRAAWGIVGNPPNLYTANVVYNAGNINGVPTFTPQTGTFGNNNLKNEEKHEIEFGLETRLLNNRLGFDVSYYNNKIVNQILSLTTPSTIGATGVIVNVGTLRNYGVEASVYGTPVKTRNFNWDIRLNMGFNRNKVESLMEGLDQIIFSNIDNGSMLVVAKPGGPSGDIMGYKQLTDPKSGQKVVDANGYYQPDYSQIVKVGNIQPKSTGGLINTFTYKQFSLNVLIDYHFGGQVISLSRLYGTGAGLYKNSLAGRDAEHGGLPYYVNSTGQYVGVSAGTATGPNGETIHQDGIILNGVNSSGAPNTAIIDAPNYYLNTFGWGGWPGSGYINNYVEGAVFDNNYVKLREVSLAYTLPVKFKENWKLQNLVLSLYGRNLFYIYKSLPGLDPEEGVGTNYINNATSVGSGTAVSRAIGASLRLSF